MKKQAVPRQWAWVRLTKKARRCLTDYAYDSKDFKDSSFLSENQFTYFGEIPNMRGHCIVRGSDKGEIFAGYHISDFEEVPEDEC